MPRSGSASNPARPRLKAGCLALALVGGSLLTGCSSGSGSRNLADQACAHIERGLAAEHRASTVGSARGTLLRTEALDQIRAALPLAAVAAGEDTTWQALEATLSESNRVPLRYLLPALSAQCAGMD
jgi:hypothetical protein